MEKVKVFHNGKRVWSAGHIRNNTFFGPFQGDVDIMASRILNIQEPAKQLQEKDHILDLCIETDEQIWLQVVPGALCKWDPTMEMIRGPDNEIYLRTTRDIMPREELRAWFSPSLKRELEISNNDMDVKSNGIGQQCPTCDMINQRSLFTTQTHHQCQTDKEKREKHENKYEERSRSSTLPLTQSSSSLEQVESPSYELDSNVHHDFHSAFRRLANSTFQPFEDPQLASLISSFSEPRNLKETSSETVADHHKNEFRKKFQGNEHYLKKHLYREGPAFSKQRRFLTSFAIQKPFKCEQMERNCRSVMTTDDERRDDFHSRELDMMFSDASRFSHIERNNHIWSPYRTFPEDLVHTSTADRRHTEMAFASTLESFHEGKEKQNTEKYHHLPDKDIESRGAGARVTCHETTCPCSSKCKASVRKQSNSKEDSQNVVEIAEQIEKETNESENQINVARNLESQNTVSSGSTQKERDSNSSPSIESVKEQSIVPRYCFTAPSPWLFPDPPFLSSVAHFHERSTTLSMSSLARYQHINQFTLPYTLSSGPQSSPRASQGFTCDFCGKVYCRKYVLKIHMRTHTGFKPLKCKFCDKSFSDPSNMKKHVKLHDTENTVHKCKHCGRNFVRYRGLLNHIKSKHTEPLHIGMII